MERIICIAILVLYGVVMLLMCYISIFPKEKKPLNNVRFYVTRDKEGLLTLFLSKPVKTLTGFTYSTRNGSVVATSSVFNCFGLNVEDFNDLRFEDEPVEVFLNLED